MTPRHSSWLALVSLLAAGHIMAAGFHSTGPGARPLSLGGAFTGLADDPSAAFYNPAGLAGQRGAVMLEHVPINDKGLGLDFDAGRLDYLGVQYPSKLGTFGLSMQQFAIGGIEGRTTLADQSTEIKVTQTLYAVPYAVAFRRLALGFTGKAVSYNIGRHHDSGFGADVGAIFSLFDNDTRLGRQTRVAVGFVVRNALSPRLKIAYDPVALERVYAGGLSMTALVHESYVKGEDRVTHDRLAVTFDATRGGFEENLSVAAGMEYSLRDRYALRSGMNAARDLTLGIGYGGAASAFRVDYAAVLTALAPQHHFSITWQFTAPPAPVESDVRMTGYRRAVFDQERLKDRYSRDGREAAQRGNYADALSNFSRAQVLDPRDKTVRRQAESAREGDRISGVKIRLDAARRAQEIGNQEEAARSALDAVAYDPQSAEAAEFLVEYRNAAIEAGIVGNFELIRERGVDMRTAEFVAAQADFNIVEMWRLLRVVKTMNPDNRAAWEPLQEKVTAAEAAWPQTYSVEAQDAARRDDAVDLARALRRIRRVNSQHQALALYEPKLARLAKRKGLSWYDGNYMSQLYNNAAVQYSLSNYGEAVEHLTQLVKARADHEDANRLIDRMRVEGAIKEADEP